MSLIADALARTRREAAVLENARGGRPGRPVVTPPRQPARRGGAVVLTVFALAGAGVALAQLAGAGGDQPRFPTANASDASVSPTPAAVATGKPLPEAEESGPAAARSPSESAPQSATTDSGDAAFLSPVANVSAPSGGLATPASPNTCGSASSPD